MENWKDVIGFEGYYQISDCGRVKSLSRIVVESTTKINHVLPELFMKSSLSKGYPCVKLRKDNKYFGYASRETGINQSSIYAATLGRMKNAGGFLWINK